MLVPRFLTNAYDIGHAVIWITAMMVCNTLYLFYVVHPNFVLTIQKYIYNHICLYSGLIGHLILGYFQTQNVFIMYHLLMSVTNGP